MKLISLNTNGIRSAQKKGLFDFIDSENPDIFLIQEAKAPESALFQKEWEERGYQIFSCLAEKAGYSGVVTFTKIPPKSHKTGWGNGIFQTEGRSVLLEFQNFRLWNLYFPSGSSGEERQAVKFQFLKDLDLILEADKLEKQRKPLVLVGDVNIAHTEKDIHNPKGNQKSSGFLPEERAWMSSFLERGFLDCYRENNPDKVEYSWWTFRFNARANNKGWRIDYFLAEKSLQKFLQASKIHTEVVLSDHAPIELILDRS